MGEGAAPLWAALVAGSFGGLLNAVVGHPFDTLKVRAQADGPTAAGESGKNLFAGVLSPIAGSTPFWAVFYFGYKWGRALQPDAGWVSILRAGAIAGACSSVVYTPVQGVKCLAQAERISSLAALRRLTKDGSQPLGVFRGFTAALAYSIPSQAAFYCVYELALSKLPWLKGLLRTAVAGGLGGVAEFTVGMPMDCVKTRVQTGSEGALRVVRTLWRSHGWRGFYRGYCYAVLRAFPANGGMSPSLSLR
jgi:hypothetical protein